MAAWTLFANVTELDTPNLDTNFNALANLSVIQGTLSGTNTITFTPTTAGPTFSAYALNMIFAGIATATNTGATAFNAASIGTLSVYKDSPSGPVALTGNEIITDNYVGFAYDSSLAGGAGGFHLLRGQNGAASSATTPSNPSGTTSTTAVMMGLGSTATLTPTFSGRVLLTICGSIANATSGDGATAQLSYGTGAAPANGVALTGTQVGNAAAFTAAAAAQKAPFSLTWCITGLTPGTAYWFDLAVAAVTGGTATVTALSATALEV